LAVLIGVLATVGGCGNAMYVMSIDEAEGHVEEAQAIEADRYATYEFYSAQARLEEAKRQAAQAQYRYAIDLADEASGFAKRATAKAKKARAKALSRPAVGDTPAAADSAKP
jgi:hypothetical protein